MSFYDIDPMALPEGAKYYHNVLIVSIAIPSKDWEFEENEIWYLDKITDARPTAYIFYKEPELNDEVDENEEPILFEITLVPHCVLEVNEDNSVCWYSTDENKGFNLEDYWRIR